MKSQDRAYHRLPLFLSGKWGRRTTCIVMTPPGSSTTGSLESAIVLLFSSIFPAWMSCKLFTTFGPFSLSTKMKAAISQEFKSIPLPTKEQIWGQEHNMQKGKNTLKLKEVEINSHKSLKAYKFEPKFIAQSFKICHCMRINVLPQW